MASPKYKYCPVCGGGLIDAEVGERNRQCCADPACGHVFWNNPVPVVTAIVEHEGQLLLARNVAWPQDMFTVIAGFLEANEEPEAAILREVKEELGLQAELVAFLGTHSFALMNHIIFTYHVQAEGPITLNEELAEYQRMPFEQGYYWPISTGLVLRDFLRARGIEPQERPLPPQMQAYIDRVVAGQ